MEQTPPMQSAPTRESSLIDILQFAIITTLIVIPIRFYIAQPFVVNGASMDPTFENGQYLIVDEISYRFQKPARGDVIIFKFPLDPAKFLIKRIVGLPGETVSFKNDHIEIAKGTSTPVVLAEPYIVFESREPNRVVTLKDNQYYVLGDNRPKSYDSRLWGPLEGKDIIGRPVLRLFPFGAIGIFPGTNNARKN